MTSKSLSCVNCIRQLLYRPSSLASDAYEWPPGLSHKMEVDRVGVKDWVTRGLEGYLRDVLRFDKRGWEGGLLRWQTETRRKYK